MAAASTSTMVTLISSDKDSFQVPEEVAHMSVTIKNMLEDTGVDSPVPLPNVTSKILSKVIEYAKFHVDKPAAAAAGAEAGTEAPKELGEEAKAWNAEFVKVDQGTLFELILAANYLNIKTLLDLTCLTVANMIKGKTPEEIRTTFNIKNDFTKEEEEEVKRENMWAFE